MAIEFDCPQCRKGLFAQDQYVGREIACPDCKTRVKIPPASGQPAQRAGEAAFTPTYVPPSAAAAPRAPSSTPQPPWVGSGTPQPYAPGGTPPPYPSGPVAPQGYAPPPQPTPQPYAAQGYAPPPQAYAAPAAGTDRPCPACGQQIKVEARQCRFCGHVVDQALQQQLGAAQAQDQYPAWRGARGGVEFGATLDVGIAVLRRFWGMGGAMIFLFGIIVSMIAMIALIPLGLIVGMAGGAGGGGGAAAGILIAVLGGLVAFAVIWLLSCVFIAGLWKVSITMADNVMGKPVEPRFEDLFSGFSCIGSVLGVNLVIVLLGFLVGLAGALLSTYLGTPGKIAEIVLTIVNYWITMRLLISVPLIMDRHRGAMEALGESWRLTSGNALIMFCAVVVGTIISWLGLILLGVGIFFTTVVMLGIIGSMYRQLTWNGAHTQGPAPGGYAPPPQVPAY
ncbi:MAG: hypothetical protein HS116_20675 [Planctomycetes bacterium]|nr:hypothetical protein [Planctomycetota bacterium]